MADVKLTPAEWCLRTELKAIAEGRPGIWSRALLTHGYVYAIDRDAYPLHVGYRGPFLTDLGREVIANGYAWTREPDNDVQCLEGERHA